MKTKAEFLGADIFFNVSLCWRFGDRFDKSCEDVVRDVELSNIVPESFFAVDLAENARRSRGFPSHQSFGRERSAHRSL